VAKSTGRGPGMDPAFLAANNAYQALRAVDGDDLDMAVAMLSQRLGKTVGTNPSGDAGRGAGAGGVGARSDGATPSAKEFVNGKRTIKEIERIAVYAYYLAHHKDTPEFNAKDIRTFRTEVRGAGFSNLPVHMDNATKAGYLTSIGGGKKGITPRGEALVEALPNREAVEAALEAHPVRGRRGKKSARKRKGGG
jgi:hypothetical protein